MTYKYTTPGNRISGDMARILAGEHYEGDIKPDFDGGYWVTPTAESGIAQIDVEGKSIQTEKPIPNNLILKLGLSLIE